MNLLSNTKGMIVYGTSRGQDTAGMNTVSLRVNGKRYLTVGAGYSMLGTVLGEALQDMLSQDELKSAKDAELYGVHTQPDGTYYLDGGCGERSMKAIAKHCGIEVTDIYNYDRKGRVKDTIGYRFEIIENQKVA